MISQWAHLKDSAEDMRRNGASLPSVSKVLGIPRSTLSGWFKGIELTGEQKAVLEENWRQGLNTARVAAAQRHRDMKQERIERMQKQVEIEYADLIKSLDPKSLEIALAMLYLGEGAKTRSGLGLGNSDPILLKFYVDALEKLYGTNRSSLGADLHLRMDQNEEELRTYWSEAIQLPLSSFKSVLRDKRTEGKDTYPGYAGVCFVYGGGVEIQRRLLYLAKTLCTGKF